jgi:putative pre-16S rRNA nuclease
MVSNDVALIALDVGERRIGVAFAWSITGIASPLTTLDRTAAAVNEIQNLIEFKKAGTLIVGLPRGLDGQDTLQTTSVRQFVSELQSALNIPVKLQDEALTSHKAETELNARQKPYKKSDIDALAATYILEDYMAGHQKDNH